MIATENILFNIHSFFTGPHKLIHYHLYKLLNEAQF